MTARAGSLHEAELVGTIGARFRDLVRFDPGKPAQDYLPRTPELGAPE